MYHLSILCENGEFEGLDHITRWTWVDGHSAIHAYQKDREEYVEVKGVSGLMACPQAEWDQRIVREAEHLIARSPEPLQTAIDAGLHCQSMYPAQNVWRAERQLFWWAVMLQVSARLTAQDEVRS